MTTYAETRCSRIPWVGKMPSHWHTAPLSSLVDENKVKNTGLIETNLLSLSYGKLIRKDINTVGGLLPASFEGYQVLKPGHIVLRMTDLQNDQRSLRSAISTEHGIITSAYIGLIPHVDVNSKFLKWVLFAYDIAKAFYAFGGGVRQSLTFNDLKKLPILLPSTEEQESIVRYLDSETAEIDDLEAKLCEQRALLEKYKRQMVTQTVKWGLDPDAPTENCGVPWLGSVPSHWEIRTLSFLTDENKVKNSDLQERNLLSLSYGSLVRKDVEDAFGLLPASFDGYQIVEDGYIVLRMTDLQNDHRSLRTAIATERGIITNAYIGLIPRPSIDSRYLAWLLRAIDLQKVFYGLGSGVRQSLSYTELRKLPILLPPLDEQRAIADYIDDKTVEIDTLMADIDRQVELLETYRKQLISDVVTGKIRVSKAAE